MKVTPKHLKEIWDSIPSNFETETYRLVYSKTQWLRIRELEMYNFTDEQLENAPNNKGFICNSNGVDLYLTPLL